MKISVLIPTYNAEKTIRECIDSIISQDFDDFEIFCVDDGSEDDTLSIIKEYAQNYSNVRYLENDHMGISESLNYGLYEVIGSEYTVRIDADDIMAENRLKHQYQYMESHPDIDILGSGAELFGNINYTLRPIEGEMIYTKDNLYQLEDSILHPTVIMRNSSIKKMDWFYSDYFHYCEDTEFWVRCQKNGLKVCKEPTVVIKYRISNNQVSNKNKKIQQEGVKLIEKCYFSPKISPNGEITAVINFKNEGNNVERTIISIRATASTNIPIVVVNDGSDDGYDYKTALEKYDVDYYEIKKSVGASKARAFGAEQVKTPYFVLLDGHMRVYTHNWDRMLLNALKTHSNSIVCTDSLILYKNSFDVFIINESGEKEEYANNKVAPVLQMSKLKEYVPAFQNVRKEPEELLEEVPCVLGAVYAMSKEWWSYIHGYKGLREWGSEEPLISVKTWLLGGQCLLLHNCKIGHCYRTSATYKKDKPLIEANRLFVASLFEDNMNKFYDDEKVVRGEKFCEELKSLMDLYKEDIESERQYLKEHQIRSLEWYKEFNESKMISK